MFKLREGVACAELEYGVALLDEVSGDYWSLNPTGATVLNALLAGKTVTSAVEELSAAYSIDAGAAQRDVEELLENLQSAHLIEL